MTSTMECAMLLCFGCSWPINMVKSIRSRTARGKSLFFELLIIAGYVFGIAGKTFSGAINWVLALYFINVFFVSADVFVTLRNRRLDRVRDTLYPTPADRERLRENQQTGYRSVGRQAVARYEEADLPCQPARELDYRMIGEEALKKYHDV